MVAHPCARQTPVPVAYRQTSGRLGRVFSFPAPVAQFVQRLTGPPPVQRPLSNRSIGRYDSAVEAQRTVMRKKYENEHIDAENFMDTPWLQPDRAKVRCFRSSVLFHRNCCTFPSPVPYVSLPRPLLMVRLESSQAVPPVCASPPRSWTVWASPSASTSAS